jgi:hypothetical protein
MKYLKTMAVVAGMACTAVTSNASLTTQNPDGSLIAAGSAGSISGTVVGSPETSTFSIGGGIDTGTITSTVLSGVSGLGGLSVEYTITLTAGDLSSVGLSTFGVPQVQAGNVSGFAASDTQFTLGQTVNFDYTSFVAGDTSTVIVETGANVATSGIAGLNDSGSVNVGALVVTAVPEASTVVAGALLLLPFGLSAFRSLRKDKANVTMA